MRTDDTSSMNLSGRRLTAIPETHEPWRITDLDISNNPIVALGPAFRRFTSLQRLNLANTLLTALPPIHDFPSLKTLRANDCRIADTSGIPEDQHALQHLYLSGNLISALPSSIRNLSSLRHLDLSRNRLSELPEEIGSIEHLSTLLLDENRLESLPPALSDLAKLEYLSVRRNQLQSLPASLASLAALSKLDLEANPWNFEIEEVVPYGTAAVLSYLDSLRDAVPRYEAKVLVVGEGNVGKSCLVDALRDLPFTHKETTHGTAISHYRIPETDSGCSIDLNIWDFGGQDFYRATHQVFFSEHAVYIVVWKPREGMEANAVDAWITMIRLRVKNCRVLIAATHADSQYAELDYEQLREKHGPMLRGFHKVDSFTGSGISELLRAIGREASTLPHMGTLWSPRWTAVQREITVDGQPQISMDHFQDVCSRLSLNRREAKTVLRLLNSEGHIVHFGSDDGLKDTVVVRPEWMTKAIAHVLKDQIVRGDLGILEHSRLPQIWNSQLGNDKYSADHHPYFLRLMEKFDISYRLDDGSRSLVAQLVPFARPPLPWSPGIRPVHPLTQLVLFCRMKERPPGLIPWLTVRTHRYSSNTHWRRGVFLRNQGTEAIVELMGDSESELIICARGRWPQFLFGTLQDILERLISERWPGLSYDLELPCPRWLANSHDDKCPGRFRLADVFLHDSRGLESMRCHRCAVETDIATLLSDDRREPLRTAIDRLSAEVAGAAHTSERAANTMRLILRAMDREAIECPRLFTLSLQSKRWIGWSHYKLQLWCEHPLSQHPTNAIYKVNETQEWLRPMAPYVAFAARLLRLAVPLAVPGLEMAFGVEIADQVRPELTSMEKIATELLSGQLDVPVTATPAGLTAAEGAGLRQLFVLLNKVDPHHEWGGLRRVRTAAGDYLWVCPEHYRQYDPGLPKLST